MRLHQEELNRLNVYPVPDGDTGTNMALTLESVSAALAQSESMADVCHAISRGSLMGARGNSGVILSQILRGLADECRDHERVDTSQLARGFRHAADAAYEAVMRPVEGTILTVAGANRRGGGSARLAVARHLVGAGRARRARGRGAHSRAAARPEGSRRCRRGRQGPTPSCSTRSLEVVDGRPIPEPEFVNTPTAVAAHLAGEDACRACVTR